MVPRIFPRGATAWLALLAGFATSNRGGAAPREVNHAYAPATWHAALGFPGDWHKPMADDRGALLTDFGPGPYARPLTRIEPGLAGGELQRTNQQWLEGLAPILRTELASGTNRIVATTFSLPPSSPAPTELRFPDFERLDGVSGAIGWARPEGSTAPEFRNVAWGTNRALRYRLRVSPGAAKQVVLGFCESYKPRLNERIAAMRVEGAPLQQADLALTAARSAPQVFVFAAQDENRDGWVGVEVSVPQGHDPNSTLAMIAVYAADARFTREDLIAGAPGAELRIDCGAESRHLPARTDVLHTEYPAGTTPTLLVHTGRLLGLSPDGGLLEDGLPFIDTQPRPANSSFTDGRWRLDFPAGTRTVTTYLHSGAVTAESAAAVHQTPYALLRHLTGERWQNAGLPRTPIVVADPRLQAMFQASIRTVAQAGETINGRFQYDSSFTLYRGLWAGDAVYLIELMAMLENLPGVRAALATQFSFQNEQGLIDEMPPLQLYRTTGATLWALAREAELSGDYSLAAAHWPQVLRAVDALRRLRRQTLTQPNSANAGLLPAGFNDGGIMEIGAEYSSVYWSITGLQAAATLARRLHHGADANAIAELAAAFTQSFQRHARRDLRTTPAGHRYLPVRVGWTGPDEVPQLAQWAVLEAHLFSDWLPLDGELLLGSLDLLAAAEKQGLPHSTGWLRNGIWAGYGALYAHLPLLLGRDEKAADLLYAVANHASPLGSWVEEQSAAGDPVKLAGDQPHCWASALFARLLISCLALDHGGTLHLLPAVPAEWLQPSAVNWLAGLRTAAGTVSLTLAVSADGRSATIDVAPINRDGFAGTILLHTRSLTRAGFRLAGAANEGEPIRVTPGQPLHLQLSR